MTEPDLHAVLAEDIERGWRFYDPDVWPDMSAYVATAVIAALREHPDLVMATVGEQVGVDYCTAHHGVRNEDEEGCDFAHHNDERCDLTPLYVAWPCVSAEVADDLRAALDGDTP